MHTLEVAAIFIIVMFLYIHINYHLRVSNEREVHKLHGPLRGYLDDLCAARQPVVFNSPHPSKFGHKLSADNIAQESPSIVAIRDGKSLPYKEARQAGVCTIERRALDRANILVGTAAWLTPLEPVGTVTTKHELAHGARGASTNLTQEFSFRHYIMPCDSMVTVKLLAPSFSRYTNTITVAHTAFPSQQATGWEWEEGNGEIEVMLEPGQALYIPSHWWFAVRFDSPGILMHFRFVTSMNYIANMRFLINTACLDGAACSPSLHPAPYRKSPGRGISNSASMSAKGATKKT